MSPAPLTPAERFAGIIAMMVGMIGARLERPGKPGLAGPLTFAIHLRLQRIRNRITRYCDRFRAGTLTPPRPRARPAASRGRAGPAKPSPWANLPDLPRGRMWLVRLVPGIGVGASHLSILLDDPEMQAMFRAAPQIGRTLRPFWHMLSRDPLPPLLQRPKPAPAPASPADAPPPAEAGGPPASEPLRAPLARRRQEPPPAPAVAGPASARSAPASRRRLPTRVLVVTI